MNQEKTYVPFGPEWEKEMMKMKKKDLVYFIKNIKERERLIMAEHKISSVEVGAVPINVLDLCSTMMKMKIHDHVDKFIEVKEVDRDSQGNVRLEATLKIVV